MVHSIHNSAINLCMFLLEYSTILSTALNVFVPLNSAGTRWCSEPSIPMRIFGDSNCLSLNLRLDSSALW